VFEVRDDDLSHVLVDTVPPDEEANVLRAVRTCPRAAISVED
ncbi:MAG: ferredoxin, partial [Dehalococcoidia bacterium]|nr:ferredoxin [Dehalococcoidia bacterium]